MRYWAWAELCRVASQHWNRHKPSHSPGSKVQVKIQSIVQCVGQDIGPKKKRTGIDPFTKVERVFAAKPATVKIKTRALKKLKDAAL